MTRLGSCDKESVKASLNFIQCFLRRVADYKIVPLSQPMTNFMFCIRKSKKKHSDGKKNMRCTMASCYLEIVLKFNLIPTVS